MIEDMTLREGETEMYAKILLQNFEERKKALDEKGKSKMNTYYAFRNALFATFRSEIIVAAIYFTISEGLAVGFTSFLLFFIEFLKDPDAPTEQGVQYLVIFSAMMICSVVFPGPAISRAPNMLVLSLCM